MGVLGMDLRGQGREAGEAVEGAAFTTTTTEAKVRGGQDVSVYVKSEEGEFGFRGKGGACADVSSLFKNTGFRRLPAVSSTRSVCICTCSQKP